jgi:hypothetical protein
MNASQISDVTYAGFEQGPIRPPSEAYSLLIRVTRNCPWNRCTFCHVYKGAQFSRRPVAHVKADIDAVHRYSVALQQAVDGEGYAGRAELVQVAESVEPRDLQAFRATLHWFAGGRQSVFLQDANSLIVKPTDLVEILNHLRTRFPWVKRITSYARSHTLARMKDGDLKAIAEAGLTRIHTGMESGCDRVLDAVKKGVTKEMHVRAGLNVRIAGIELSEYYMPGLGGRTLWKEHALETADAMNQINPDFIRLRTLTIPDRAPLSEDQKAGRFEKCTDVMVAQEILTFIENLEGITSTVKSDHILNLFGDLEGTLPQEKERMMEILRTFLALEPQRQRFYQVGRRLGVFYGLSDLQDPLKVAKVEMAWEELGITPHNADQVIDEMMKRFI